MIKNIGIEMTDEIYNIIKSGKIVGLLTTFSETGTPHLTPISTIFPKNKESVLLAMLVDSIGYKNMVWQKKVVFSIIEASMSVHMVCRAGVVRAPSRTHPEINIVLIDIIDIIEENMALISIKEGITWSQISPEMKVLYDTLMSELHECATSL